MTEQEIIGWVVKAIVLLIGLYFVVYNPMKDNVKAITKLTCSIDTMNEKLINLETNNTESHRRLWDATEKNGSMIDAHERRLHDLDGKWSVDNSE